MRSIGQPSGASQESKPEDPPARGASDTTQVATETPTSDAFDLTPTGGGEGDKAGRFAPGQTIAGRFTILRYIARGGMGEVYEVEDGLLQSAHVALKVILPEIADDAGSSRRFEQEVLLARKVTHPNLCPIYDIARCENPSPPFLFLTMRLLEGETLSRRLRRAQPFSREETVVIFRQITAGIAAIHAAGIIHRDIKPNNVMLDSSGQELHLTVMDFGLARVRDPEETIGTCSLVAGTPGYMAPEVLKGEGPSQATDLFALGVLLHQVLTGERPRIGALTLRVEPSPALATADAPPEFISAVREFLAVDPQRRCSAFQELQSYLNGSAVFSQTRSVRISRRNFVVGSAAAACAAAAAVALDWNSLYDSLHPLPSKRFVALLNWPPPEAGMRPMLLGVTQAIGNELARAEAFNHNLLVLASTAAPGDLTTPRQIDEARESLGANLILAASGTTRPNELNLSLRVLDSPSAKPLRAKEIRVPLNQQQMLPQKAVRAAAGLLGITRFDPDDQHSNPGTSKPDAYAAFQAAEALRAQENDTGLDEAIAKYKHAIELDPRYAVAQAALAWAYLRYYGLHHDPGALTLAGLNCKSAIQLNPDLVAAHLGLASVHQQTGDNDGALGEMSKALALDPSNPHTLTYQADFFAAENRWADAERTFGRVLELRPNYWLGHQELGYVLDLEGKYREALTEFRTASLAAPQNALAIKNVGSVNLQLGKLPEAFDSLNASFKMKQDSDTAEDLAELFRVQQKYPEALDYASRAVTLDPHGPYHWLELGDVYTSNRNARQAEAAYRQAASEQAEELQTSPKEGPGWMSLALLSAKLGEPDRALTLIAKAESLHADDMGSQLAKVRTLELAGRREDALAAVQRCLARGPVQFQLDSMPDLEGLRATAEYKNLLVSSPPANQAM